MNFDTTHNPLSTATLNFTKILTDTLSEAVPFLRPEEYEHPINMPIHDLQTKYAHEL